LGIAAQLILMNGPPLRLEPSCSALATSSLPVPLSPVISTVDGESATRSITANTPCISAESPTSPNRPRMSSAGGYSPAWGAARLAAAWPHRLVDDRADLLLLERLLDVVEGAGLDRLDRLADRAVGGDHDDGTCGWVRIAALRSTSMPSSRGIRRSVITTSTPSSAAIASAPSVAWTTSWPSRLQDRRPARAAGSARRRRPGSAGSVMSGARYRTGAAA
jgi:hypothetical protein